MESRDSALSLNGTALARARLAARSCSLETASQVSSRYLQAGQVGTDHAQSSCSLCGAPVAADASGPARQGRHVREAGRASHTPQVERCDAGANPPRRCARLSPPGGRCDARVCHLQRGGDFAGAGNAGGERRGTYSCAASPVASLPSGVIPAALAAHTAARSANPRRTSFMYRPNIARAIWVYTQRTGRRMRAGREPVAARGREFG